MSGGVDSSVVAGMLHARGNTWSASPCSSGISAACRSSLREGGATGRCCSLDDVYDARHVAQHSGIPYYVVNFEERFEEQVVKPFIDEYLAGRTPIPCTLCNNFIKFDQFLEMAAGVGADAHRHRPLRAHRLERRHRPLGNAPQRGSRQGPDLFSVRPEAGAAGAHACFRWADAKAAGARAGARAGHSHWPKSPIARRFVSSPTATTPRSSTLIFGSKASRAEETQGELVDYRRPRGRRARGRASFHRRPAARAAASPRASLFTSSRPSPPRSA